MSQRVGIYDINVHINNSPTHQHIAITSTHIRTSTRELKAFPKCFWFLLNYEDWSKKDQSVGSFDSQQRIKIPVVRTSTSFSMQSVLLDTFKNCRWFRLNLMNFFVFFYDVILMSESDYSFWVIADCILSLFMSFWMNRNEWCSTESGCHLWGNHRCSRGKRTLSIVFVFCLNCVCGF